MINTTPLTKLFTVLGVIGLIATSAMPAQAASAISANSPEFDMKLTSCLSQFDWQAYVDAQRAGLQNSSTWKDIGCASDANFIDNGQVKKTAYNQFEVGPAAKNALGDLPVLDIFANGAFAAQSLNTYNENGTVKTTAPVFNRTNAAALGNIFTTEQLGQMYSNGGEKTGAPRVFSTGKDVYNQTQSPRVYQGGWCKIENGQIKVRTQRAGTAFNPADYGRSVDNAESSCARTVNGNKLNAVEDMKFEAYQFIFEITYPNAAQCADWFGIPVEQYEANCLTFFRNKYGKNLTGNSTTGNKVYATYTYYGAFSQPIDGNYNWVGWHNPNIGGPRATATDTFVKSYDGFSTYVK
jgi:hypothetical protein